MSKLSVLRYIIFSLAALSGAFAAEVLSNDESLAKFYDDNLSYWARFLPAVNDSLNKNIDVDVAFIGG